MEWGIICIRVYTALSGSASGCEWELEYWHLLFTRDICLDVFTEIIHLSIFYCFIHLFNHLFIYSIASIGYGQRWRIENGPLCRYR